MTKALSSHVQAKSGYGGMTGLQSRKAIVCLLISAVLTPLICFLDDTVGNHHLVARLVDLDACHARLIRKP